MDLSNGLLDPPPRFDRVFEFGVESGLLLPESTPEDDPADFTLLPVESPFDPPSESFGCPEVWVCESAVSLAGELACWCVSDSEGAGGDLLGVVACAGVSVVEDCESPPVDVSSDLGGADSSDVPACGAPPSEVGFVSEGDSDVSPSPGDSFGWESESLSVGDPFELSASESFGSSACGVVLSEGECESSVESDPDVSSLGGGLSDSDFESSSGDESSDSLGGECSDSFDCEVSSSDIVSGFPFEDGLDVSSSVGELAGCDLRRSFVADFFDRSDAESSGSSNCGTPSPGAKLSFEGSSDALFSGRPSGTGDRFLSVSGTNELFSVWFCAVSLLVAFRAVSLLVTFVSMAGRV